MKYRPDIEGLRAVAVIPVILFHAGAPYFGGGFVGVDIFFVISGFLITSLILDEQQTGRFTILGFYERRARRILPALFGVLLFCAVAGAILLTPHDYRSLALSATAVVLFVSNFRFWWQSGYFDPATATRPLLHTWSLAVEEQFYVVFPVYLWAATRYSTRLCVQITALLFVASLVLCATLTTSFPVASFFLAPTRIWELMLGALLSLGAVPSPKNAQVANVGGLLGLGLIAGSIILISRDTPFPGLAATVPTAGAALVIWSGQSASLANRVLQWTPLAFVGRTSYSLYLWHFPILEFARYVSLGGITGVQTTQLVALASGIAVLSWRFIEQPFRDRGFLKRSQIFTLSAAVSLAFLAGYGLIFATNGLPQRLDNRSRALASGADDVDPDRSDCLAQVRLPTSQRYYCRFGSRVEPPQFILWGDSIAETKRAALETAARQTQSTGVFAGYYGCAPSIGVNRQDELECGKANTEILNYVLSSNSIKVVILDAHWNWWANGHGITRGGNRGIPIVTFISADEGVRPKNNSIDVLTFGLRQLLTRLRAARKDVWLVSSVPEIGYDVPKALFVQNNGFSESVRVPLPVSEFNRRQDPVVRLFHRLEGEHLAKVLWIEPFFCDDEECSVARNGRTIYSDGFHLTRYGSQILAPALTSILRTAAATKPK